MDGILIVDKPAGITSHDVVARCRRILKTKRIGHTGTLDPFATGVVVILVERATRLAQFLDKDAKEYEALVRFGFETDTGDRTGELRTTDYGLRNFSDEELENVLRDFRGAIEQTPPMYSAKKIDGKKLYELARKGVEIERKAVNINIYDLELLDKTAAINDEPQNEPANHRLPITDRCLRVACSAGTYIRTLAEDIGRKLGTGAHLTELRRTRAGKFGIDQAVTLEKLEEVVSESKLDDYLIAPNDAISHLPEIALSDAGTTDVKNGKRLLVDLPNAGEGDFVRLTGEGKNLIAVAVYNSAEKTVQPKVVLI